MASPSHQEQAHPQHRQQHQQNHDLEDGSSVFAAIFNFTNSIIGAGAIGLGGALAQSGGGISIVLLTTFALLTKRSLDLVIELSVRVAEENQQLQQLHRSQPPPPCNEAQAEQGGRVHEESGDDTFHDCHVDPLDSSNTSSANADVGECEPDSFDDGIPPASTVERPKCSYEELAQHVLGSPGRWTVSINKFLYSFGCLIAYIVVIKDNVGCAVRALMVGGNGSDVGQGHQGDADNYLWWINNDIAVTWLLSAFILLPLCLLRDPTPLAKFSVVSVVTMGSIVVLVVYVFVTAPELRTSSPHSSFEVEWLTVRWGVLESLGTFVFTFVSQHTAHLVFDSMQPRLRTVKNWQTVSSASIAMALSVSLVVSILVYTTFGANTTSDIFELYPADFVSMDSAKLLLSITMLLTFPLPFFTCRELLVVSIFSSNMDDGRNDNAGSTPEESTLREPLLLPTAVAHDDDGDTENVNSNHASAINDTHLHRPATTTSSRFVCPDNGSQLRLPYHTLLTVLLWCLITSLAIAAPSLGDVLDLVGCATGTMIAFIVPSLLSLRMDGFTCGSAVILLVGGTVGGIGTWCSLKHLIQDM